MDSEATASELAGVIATLVEDTNRMWADGVVSPDSAVLLVEDGLAAVQYAPHYENGVWQASTGEAWLEGIVHTWGDADRRPAQAFFLETWRRGEDGRWRLARHTAEKA